MFKRIAYHLAHGLLCLALMLPVGALVGFVAINWATNCQSWDREQWTQDSSCVTPTDVWRTLKGG